MKYIYFISYSHITEMNDLGYGRFELSSEHLITHITQIKSIEFELTGHDKIAHPIILFFQLLRTEE